MSGLLLMIYGVPLRLCEHKPPPLLLLPVVLLSDESSSEDNTLEQSNPLIIFLETD